MFSFGCNSHSRFDSIAFAWAEVGLIATSTQHNLFISTQAKPLGKGRSKACYYIFLHFSLACEQKFFKCAQRKLIGGHHMTTVVAMRHTFGLSA